MTKEDIEEGRRLHAGPDKFAFEAWLIRHSGELIRLAESTRSEYARGLRRGLELAKEHAYITCSGGKCGECSDDANIDWSDAGSAVDKECE